MATIQTRLKFNIRKKRLNSAKLNTGKENENDGNKRSSAVSACVERGRKFYKNKHQSEGEESLSRPYLLSDDGSDNDLDTECVAIKQHGSKADGNKTSQCIKRLQVGNTGDEPMGLFI
jgi:hypothetical protein